MRPPTDRSPSRPRRLTAPMRRVVVAAVLTAAAAPARGETLTGRELLAEIADSTLSGYHSGGVHFSEYHAPDGRVFGFNNGEAVQDGCWTVRGDAVCYYYGEGSITGEFCWRLDRAGTAGYRVSSLESTARGIVRREPGNPRALSDGGKAWTCEALISRRPLPERFARR